MEQEVKLLDSMIKSEKFWSDKIDELMEEFKSSNSALFLKQKGCRERITELKEQIKPLAIAEFEKTQEKKLYGGIGIRVNKKLSYGESEAIEWARKNMPVCIKEVLDKKTFENFVKTSPISIVQFEESPSVTFPSVLTLEENGNKQ